MKDFMPTETMAIQPEAKGASLEEMSLQQFWQRWKKGILGIAVILVLIAPADFGFQLATMHNPVQVLTAFNKALVGRDYDKAYDLLDDDTKANISLANFVEVQRRQQERNGALQGLDTSTIELHRINTGTAAIDASLQFDAGRVPFHFELRRKHLLWHVYMVKEE